MCVYRVKGAKSMQNAGNLEQLIERYGNTLLRTASAMLAGKTDPGILYTWIADTVESHRIVAAAELSRKEGGRLVTSEEIPDIEK